MDQQAAQQVRQNERAQRIKKPDSEEFRLIAHQAKRGTLVGEVLLANDRLYFRPEMHDYLVPIDMDRSESAHRLFPNAMFRVTGEIVMKRGLPQSAIIHSAEQL